MREKEPKNNVLFLLHYAWQRNKLFYVYLILNTLCLATIPFINIFLPKLVIGEIMGEGRIRVFVMLLGIAMLLYSVLYMASSYLKSLYYPTLNRLRHSLLNAMEEKCMHIAFRYIEEPKILDNKFMVWQAVNGVEHGVEGIYRRLYLVAAGFISLLGYTSLVGVLSPWILVYLLANVLIMWLVQKKARHYTFKKHQELARHGRKEWYLNDMMSDFELGKEIRVYHLADWLGNWFKGVKEESLHLRSRIQNKNLQVSVIDIVLMIVRDGVIYGYLIYNVLYQNLGIDNFLMYFMTISSFSIALNTIMGDIHHIRMQDMILNEYRQFMALPNEEEAGDAALIPDDTTYELTFNNVSFKYPHTDQWLFKDLSFTITKGQKLAIVGVNGAGKTTLVKLMTRLYEPDSGEILINGVSIHKLPLKLYRKLLGVVFQEIKLFAFPITENIGMAPNEKLDRQRLEKVIKKAGLDEKIATLSKGLDTSLMKHLDSEGIMLSGGENQKLALARALYKEGRIMILDEPTAALDPLREREIYENFNTLTEGKTTVFISHRLASTKFCDKIMLFENGQIKEEGTHEALMLQEGDYYTMFKVQAKYYTGEEGGVNCG